MDFEFVEFYPVNEQDKGKISDKIVGTVHIYCIDCKLDIRGIQVSFFNRGVYFNIPRYPGYDENGKKIRYPLISWTNQEDNKSMLNFLHNEVKPIIKKRMGKV